MDDMQNPGSAPMTPPPAPQQPPAPQMAPQAAPNNGERRGMAALSYLGVFCLIPLIFAKDSAFAQYHAKQGIVLAIVGIVLKLVSDLLWNVPFGGALVSVVSLVLFIVSVMGIVKALRGEKFEIPYISEWAVKIHF
jgi:uncharacterized membrane protein